MSTSILYIKPEDVESVEKRQKYTVSIMGCRKIGVLSACLFAKAGFKVICVDADHIIVNNLKKGKAPFLRREIESLLRKHVKNGVLKATTDIEMAVAQSDVIIILTSVKIDEKKRADYSDIERVCKQVGLSLRRGSLVIIASVVGIGVMNGLIKEILENNSGFKVGIDFGLAYSPIRILGEETLENLSKHKWIVAATEKNSLNAASTLLEIITKSSVVRTDNVKLVEVATLFEATQREVNIALVNEYALFCEKVGVDYFKAQSLTDRYLCSAFALPTITCGNAREELYLLMEEAENINVKLRIPATAKEVNKDSLRHAINLIRKALRSCGKPLKRAKISLLGISKTPNMKDAPKISAMKLAKTLETKGAKVSLYDPYLTSKELVDMGCTLKKNLTETAEGADCIVILTAHERFKRLRLKKLKFMMKMPAAIVDFKGVIEPEKVEMEGFIYRGLGRGVWTM